MIARGVALRGGAASPWGPPGPPGALRCIPVSRPPPLRTDGSNEFARYSMQVRVPRIVRDVVERNPDYSPEVRGSLEQLARDIESNAPLPAPRHPAPDLKAWTAAHAEHAHESWLDA